ncbi:MAG: hypothetical protein ACLR8S_05235 [Paraprevotella clara]
MARDKRSAKSKNHFLQAKKSRMEKEANRKTKLKNEAFLPVTARFYTI